MRKFTKISLIIAAILAVLGISFFITGIVCGGNVRDMINSVSWSSSSNTVVNDEENVNDFEEAFKGIDSLDLELGIIEMEITASSDDQFRVYGNNLDKTFKCVQKGSLLYIESNKKNTNWGPKVNHKTPHIILEVPKGTVFEKTELNVGVGDLKAEKLESKEMDINCGLGRVDIQGAIYGDCDIECGLGDVSLSLSNSEEDFNYDIECGIGDVKLNGKRFSGLRKSKDINNNAESRMVIECGIGKVDVSFND